MQGLRRLQGWIGASVRRCGQSGSGESERELPLHRLSRHGRYMRIVQAGLMVHVLPSMCREEEKRRRGRRTRKRASASAKGKNGASQERATWRKQSSGVLRGSHSRSFGLGRGYRAQAAHGGGTRARLAGYLQSDSRAGPFPGAVSLVQQKGIKAAVRAPVASALFFALPR